MPITGIIDMKSISIMLTIVFIWFIIDITKIIIMAVVIVFYVVNDISVVSHVPPIPHVLKVDAIWILPTMIDIIKPQLLV